MNKVGIVILNYNCSDFLHLTLDSLSRAQTDVEFSVGIIDNGSDSADMHKAERYFDAFLKQGFEGFFIASEKNLGFSGGNNTVIKRFLEDSKISHICMLNADVIVTDGWLDHLLSCTADIVGPVTNATGNEQTILVDYQVSSDLKAFETVNRFAAKRYASYGNYTVESDVLYFFNTVFKRTVFDSVGLLDERFFPGSFEDNDFCLRVKAAGMTQRIVRGCYVHHFGSGSFSKLDMPKRLEITNVNRQRFEEKWGIRWEDDTWKRLESCRQDLTCFAGRPLDDWAQKQISDAIISIESLIKNWAAAISWFQSDQYITKTAAERGLLPKDAAVEESMQSTHHAPDEHHAGPVSAANDVPSVKPHATETLLTASYSFFIPYTELSGKQLLKLAWIKALIKMRKFVGSDPAVPKMSRRFQSVWTLSGRKVMLQNNALDVVSGKMMIRLAIKRAIIKLKRLFTRTVELTATASGTASTAAVKDYNNASAGNIDMTDRNEMGKPAYIDPFFRELISKAREAGKACIAVFAPMFSKEDERDGYIQRIRAIDECVLKDLVRIYLYQDALEIENWNIKEIDSEHIYIRFSSQDPAQRERVFALVRECGLMYVHSINRFMIDSVAAEMLSLFDEKDVVAIWDVHGAVPEEYLMNGSETGCLIANMVEKYVYERSDVIITVNNAMRECLQNKYGQCKGEFITLPIFTAEIANGIDCAQDKQLLNSALPVVVYAGGLQIWQNVGLMKDLMVRTAGKLRFRIFVPNPHDFWPEDMPQHVKDNMLVSSRRPEDIGKEYQSCHYGLVLRDDDIVNNVACPTKLIEYIQYGIVPVFKSERIGDFVRLGLKYVTYERFAKGDIPSESERIVMAEDNYKVLKSLLDSYQSGLTLLMERLSLELSKKKNHMNILVVSEAFAGGGLETHIHSYYKELRNKHSFFFAFGSFKKHLDIDTSAVYSSFNFLWESTIAQFIKDVEDLVKLIKEKNISIIHVHPFFSLFPALVAGQLTHTPVVFTYHGIASFSFPARLNDTILYYYGITELVNKIFTVSDTGKCALENNMGIRDAVFLPNSVDLKIYRKHSVVPNKRWAVVSRLDADNGKEECLRKLFRMLPSLDIEGVDIYGDGSRRQALEEYAESFGLSKKVRWMGFQSDLYERLDGNYNGIIGTDRVTVEALTMGYPVLQMGYGRINGIMDSKLLDLARTTNFDSNILPEILSADELNAMLHRVYTSPSDYCFRNVMEEAFDIAKTAKRYEGELHGLKCREHANICEFYRALKDYKNQDENFYRSHGVFTLLKDYVEYYAVNPSIKNLFLIGNYNNDLTNVMNNHINGLNWRIDNSFTKKQPSKL